jgi:hypothetical protein
VVLVADEEHLPPVAVRILLDLGNPVQHSPLAPVILNAAVILIEAKDLALIFSFSFRHGPERDPSLRSG